MGYFKNKTLDFDTETHDGTEYDVEFKNGTTIKLTNSNDNELKSVSTDFYVNIEEREAMQIYEAELKRIEKKIKQLDELDRNLKKAQKIVHHIYLAMCALGVGFILGQVLIYALGLP